jgi:hypothetical protein
MRFRLRPHPAMEFKGLEIRVTRGQHGGESGHFHFATLAFARLFKMPVIAHDFKRPFAIDFLFQSSQGLFDWLAFFQFNFGQFNSHPLQRPWHRRPNKPAILFSQAEECISKGLRCQSCKIRFFNAHFLFI